MWLSDQAVECPEYLLEKTRGLKKARVAIVNAQSLPVMQSVQQGVAENLIEPILVGDLDLITDFAAKIDLDINKFEQHAASSEQAAVTLATGLVRQGHAQLIMKGHIHTETFLRGLIDKQHGLRGNGLMTHVFHMTVPGSERALLITDAAIHVQPNFKACKSILLNAVNLAQQLNIKQPKAVILSASESVNEAMPSSVMAQQLAQWAGDEISDAQVYGPLALDCAISKKAAQIKGITHPAAGDADILVVPSIEVGNALFKMLVYYKSACSAGVVLGAKVPVILTSRSDPPQARLASIAIASILASKSG